MTRVDREEKQPVVVSQAEYATDKRRGYCITVWAPEREEVLKDPRSQKSVTLKHPAVFRYACMECRFDTTDENLIKEHLAAENPHLWKFGHFDNPYGSVADVVIEGIEDYSTKGETQ